MQVIRRRLSWLAAAWLVCQMAGLTGAPALAAFSGGDDCCPGIAPGQTCPMHHPRKDDGSCKMRSACQPPEVALLSMAGGVGILPDRTDLVIPFDSGDAVSALAPSAIARADRPDAPPPRA